VVLAILYTRLGDRLPLPVPGIFLLAAATVAGLWPHAADVLSIQAVERIAVVALVVILLKRRLLIRAAAPAWPARRAGRDPAAAQAGHKSHRPTSSRRNRRGQRRCAPPAPLA
jgi:hypothetical protein